MQKNCPKCRNQDIKLNWKNSQLKQIRNNSTKKWREY
jgi:hypothetical protein